MADRLGCCIPFCRRTICKDRLPAGHSEWICTIHWRLVTRKAKLMKRRSEAAYEAAEGECQTIDAEAVADAKASGHPGIRREFLDRFCVASDRRSKKRKQAARAWERCKRQAIEAAGGLR